VVKIVLRLDKSLLMDIEDLHPLRKIYSINKNFQVKTIKSPAILT